MKKLTLFFGSRKTEGTFVFKDYIFARNKHKEWM